MTSPSRRARLGAAALVALVVAAGLGCGESSDGADRAVRVSDATVIVPAGANTAIYLAITNEGPDDHRLVEIRGDVGESVELHETRQGDDGLMRMHGVEGVDLPAGSTVHLEPGGLHGMVFGAAALEPGDTVELELVFEHGPPLTVEAQVASHAEVIG